MLNNVKLVFCIYAILLSKAGYGRKENKISTEETYCERVLRVIHYKFLVLS